MEFGARIRVVWNARGERRWCPGATRPPESATGDSATGWTSFFRLHGARQRRRKRSGADALDDLPAALPRRAEATGEASSGARHAAPGEQHAAGDRDPA